MALDDFDPNENVNHQRHLGPFFKDQDRLQSEAMKLDDLRKSAALDLSDLGATLMQID